MSTPDREQALRAILDEAERDLRQTGAWDRRLFGVPAAGVKALIEDLRAVLDKPDATQPDEGADMSEQAPREVLLSISIAATTDHAARRLALNALAVPPAPEQETSLRERGLKRLQEATKASGELPESVACPRCDGSGSITVPSGNGPDAYDVDEVCPHCEGDGSLESAYKGVLKMLEIQRAETLKQRAKWWGIVNVKAKRDEFLLEVGETNARWLDPVGYWKEHAAAAEIAREVATDAARYRGLIDWLMKQGLLHAQFCQPPGLPVGDYWVLRGAAVVKGECAGFGKTEEAAIDAALATTTEGET